MNNQPLQRDFSTASIRAVSDDENSRTFELSFSSEEPVQMWFGTEILDHSGNAIDMSRMQSMGIVLFNHDRNRVIGKVTRAWVEDNRGKAQLLTLAENMGLDVKDLTKAKLVEAIAAAEVQAEV